MSRVFSTSSPPSSFTSSFLSPTIMSILFLAAFLHTALFIFPSVGSPDWVSSLYGFCEENRLHYDIMKIACKQQTRQGDAQKRHWGGERKRLRRSLSRPELSWASLQDSLHPQGLGFRTSQLTARDRSMSWLRNPLKSHFTRWSRVQNLRDQNLKQIESLNWSLLHIYYYYYYLIFFKKRLEWVCLKA